MSLSLFRQQLAIYLMFHADDMQYTSAKSVNKVKNKIVIVASIYGTETKAIIDENGYCILTMDMASPDESFFIPKAGEQTGFSIEKIGDFMLACYEKFQYAISDIYRG